MYNKEIVELIIILKKEFSSIPDVDDTMKRSLPSSPLMTLTKKIITIFFAEDNTYDEEVISFLTLDDTMNRSPNRL